MLSFLTIIKKIKPATIRGQLIVGVTLVLLLLMTLFVFGLIGQQRKFLKTQNHEQAFGFVTRFAQNSGHYIIENDFDELQRLTLSSLHIPHLKYAMVLSSEGVVLAHTNDNFIGKIPTDNVSLQLKGSTEAKTLIEDESILDIAAPIFVDKKMVGWARTGIGQEQIQNNLWAIVQDGLVYITIALLIGTLCAIFIGNRLTSGLYKLTSVADKIKKGDRNIRAAPFKTGELLDLGTAFNQMLDEISAGENLLSMVIEHMPVGVWMVNEKKEIVSGNTTGKHIWERQRFGSGDEHGLYKGWYTETKKLIEPHQWASARAIDRGETTINEELEIEAFDGKRKIILNSAIPLRGKEGTIMGAIVINVDITERKKITEQLALSESTFRSAFDYSAIGMA